MSRGFCVGRTLNRGVRTQRPESTRSTDTVLLDARDLHERAGKGCKHCSRPSRDEEDDRNRDADPFAPQLIKPAVGVPVIMVLGSFEMAPS